ncbi:hypothetical protein C9374_009877 [Naegleria lovaniensis]|uniref:Uncharacterized protein n=1 Tax=Naegleria lovaniensis TaxID=51637 RepID=A0AA88GIL2_NAELO|nr:uncharacterized protein C9374_009877 [Naegleria lovaniensis]KAG2375254.1 hypothetical protein C9374_009877 [Naegleria lovaniensis]
MSKKQLLAHTQLLRDLAVARSQNSPHKQSSQLELVSKKAQELGLTPLSECLAIESKLYELSSHNKDEAFLSELDSAINKVSNTFKSCSVVCDYFHWCLKSYETNNNKSTTTTTTTTTTTASSSSSSSDSNTTIMDNILQSYNNNPDTIFNPSNIELLNNQLLSSSKDLHTQLPYLFIYFRCLSLKASLSDCNILLQQLSSLSNIYEQSVDSYHSYLIQYELYQSVLKLKKEMKIEECIELLLKILTSFKALLQPTIKVFILQLLGSTLFSSVSQEMYLKIFNESSAMWNTNNAVATNTTSKSLKKDTNTSQVKSIDSTEKVIEEALLVLLTCEHSLFYIMNLQCKPSSSALELSSLASSTNINSHPIIYTPLSANEEQMIKLSNIYDQLCLSLSTIYCTNYNIGFDILKQIMERGIGTFSENAHFWFQYAILLSNNKLYHRAFKIVESVCIPLEPRNVKYYLFACTTGLKFGKITKSISLAHKAMDMMDENEFPIIHASAHMGDHGNHVVVGASSSSSNHVVVGANSSTTKTLATNSSNSSKRSCLNHLFRSKLYHILGLLYYKQSKNVSTMTEKTKLLNLSIDALVNKVHDTYDSNDYKLCYHIALVYAEMRELKEAFNFVKKSIALNRMDDKQPWILLALLFSCDRHNHVQSFKTIKMILEQYPNDIQLKLLYARMEELLESSSSNINISSGVATTALHSANDHLTTPLPSNANIANHSTGVANISNNSNNPSGVGQQTNTIPNTTATNNTFGISSSSRSVRTYSKLSDELDKSLELYTTPTMNDVSRRGTSGSSSSGILGPSIISISEYRHKKIELIQQYIFISEALRRKKLLDDATFNMSKAKELIIQLVEEIEEIESSKVASLLPSNTTPISTSKKKSDNNNSQLNMEGVQKTSRDYMTIIDLLLNNGRLQKDESQQEFIVLLKQTNAWIHCAEGRIFEDSGKIKDAIIEYEAALVNDTDCEVASLRLGVIYYKHEKQYTMSRNYLQNAVRINPFNHLSWYHLGKVLSEHFGDEEEASDCFMNSLNYEKTCPIIDFGSSEFLSLLV